MWRDSNESRCFVPLLAHKHLSNSSYRFIEENYIAIIIVIELSPSPIYIYIYIYTHTDIHIYIYTVACESLGTPCRICENVNNFNKIREIIQNACYFLFSTVLSKTFYIKYVYI